MAICPATPLNYNIQNKSTEDTPQSNTNITKSNDTQNFYFNKKTHLDKKDFDMIELSNLGKSYSYEESESDENIDQSRESDSLKESYFLQKVKYDGIDDQETLLYPDIYRTIFGFIDPNDFENISQVNKVAKKFINVNFMQDKSCFIQLKFANDVDEFISYLKDKNNNQFLKNIKLFSLDINVYFGNLYHLGLKAVNLYNSTFRSDDVPIKSQFEQLVDQLKLSPIKDLHLKFTGQVDFDFIKYLANSGMSCLTILDLSMTNIDKDGVIEILNGNLKLKALGLANNYCAKVFKYKNKGETKLYLHKNTNIKSKSMFTEGKYFGELIYGMPHGYGEHNVNSIKYDGQWEYGRMHGVGKCIYPDGSSYDGEWANGKRHGSGKRIYPDGSSYDGEWENGRMAKK